VVKKLKKLENKKVAIHTNFIQKEEVFQLHQQGQLEEDAEEDILNVVNSLIVITYLLIEEILNNHLAIFL
jgi:hypothetical protein